MPSCAFTTCTNHSRNKNKTHGVTFHAFPQNELLSHKWLSIVRRQRQAPAWTPSKNSRICSDHFKPDDTYMTSKGLKKLKNGVLPFLQFIDSPQQQQTPINSQTRRCYPDDDISETLKVLKDVSTSTSVYDDASIFGEYIAAKIRLMDPITATTVQHHIRNIISQAEMGVYSQQDANMIKEETALDESNYEAALCPGEKQEMIEVEFTASDGQKHTQDMSLPVGVYEINTEQRGRIKHETEGTDVDIGPTVLQPMDWIYRNNQQMTCDIKQENIIVDEYNDSILCSIVKREHVEDERGESNQQSTSSNSGVVGELDAKVSTQQHKVVNIMKNVVDVKLETSSINLEHIDSKYNPYKMGTNRNR